MPKKSPKFYVVWKGRQTGIFRSWEECSAQVTGFEGAEYMAFDNLAAAQRALAGEYADYRGKRPVAASQARLIAAGSPVIPSYAVDAACSGSPGPVEYRCVEVETGREVFRRGPFERGTNNVGEFLAIVHMLAILRQQGSDLPVYSDSRNAILWVRQKRCKTRLRREAANAELFDLIDRAEKWLAENTYPNKLLKWETDAWGENPADFGRK